MYTHRLLAIMLTVMLMTTVSSFSSVGLSIGPDVYHLTIDSNAPSAVVIIEPQDVWKLADKINFLITRIRRGTTSEKDLIGAIKLPNTIKKNTNGFFSLTQQLSLDENFIQRTGPIMEPIK